MYIQLPAIKIRVLYLMFSKKKKRREQLQKKTFNLIKLNLFIMSLMKKKLQV